MLRGVFDSFTCSRVAVRKSQQNRDGVMSDLNAQASRNIATRCGTTSDALNCSVLQVSHPIE